MLSGLRLIVYGGGMGDKIKIIFAIQFLVNFQKLWRVTAVLEVSFFSSSKTFAISFFSCIFYFCYLLPSGRLCASRCRRR